MTAVRVLVFANDPLARAGLATLLTGQEGVIVVGRVGTSDDLAGALDAHRPDVVLCDMGWNPRLRSLIWQRTAWDTPSECSPSTRRAHNKDGVQECRASSAATPNLQVSPQLSSHWRRAS